MRACLLLLCFGLALPVLAGWQAVISPAGAVNLQDGETAIGTLAPGVYESGWRLLRCCRRAPGRR